MTCEETKCVGIAHGVQAEGGHRVQVTQDTKERLQQDEGTGVSYGQDNSGQRPPLRQRGMGKGMLWRR